MVLVNQRTGLNVPNSKVAEFRHFAQLIKYISD